MTTVTISRKPGHRLFANVDPADIHSVDSRHARDLWRSVGGPKSAQWLLTEPSHQTKAKKASRPQYVLHLAPHTRADIGTVCPWSTPGCRDACLYTAGHGQFNACQLGRIARTKFAAQHPTEFLGLLRNNLEAIAKRPNPSKRPLIRLNGTSDIAWEQSPAGVELISSFSSRLRFADYTKATVDQRPQPTLSNYSVVRSVWTDRHTVADAVALWRKGESVSIVVDNVARLRGIPRVVDATRTDEWLLARIPRIGALSPLGDMRPADAFSADQLAKELR